MTRLHRSPEVDVRRVAVLADIHGNLPALEAVVADVERQQVDEVVVAGDLVGRGPQGSGVVERIRQLGWTGLRGNHEDYLLAFRRRQVPDHWWSAGSWAAARWMAAELTAEAEAFIGSLPLTLELASEPPLTVVHGTPASNNQGLGTWNSDREVSEHLDQVGASTLICAHTHKPMHRTVPEGEAINTGAVGLPFNGDRRAQYVVLHSSDEGWRPDFRRVDYDLDHILEIYHSSGFLAAGGVTSQLLRIELLRARPYLVPFLAWVKAHQLPSDPDSVERFLEVYREAGSLREFYRRLPRPVEPPTVGAPPGVESPGRGRPDSDDPTDDSVSRKAGRIDLESRTRNHLE